MQPELIIKIAGMGLMIAIVCQLLTKAGREDIATLTTVVGIILVLFQVLDLVADLFRRVQAIFLFP